MPPIEICELPFGLQGIEVCSKLDIYQTRRYLNYLIQQVQLNATPFMLEDIEYAMGLHLEAILNKDA